MRTLSRVYMPSLPLLARLLGRAFDQMAEGNIPADLIAFPLPVKVPIYLPRKDERFGKPWPDLNSQPYDYERVALPTELFMVYLFVSFSAI